MAEKSDKVIIGEQTIVGNMTGEAELRFTPSGAPVVNFTIAENHRKFNKESNQWEDVGTSFYRCSLWRDAAENFAESAHKGDRVMVQGRVTAECYTPQDGTARVSLNCDVNEAALSARYANVTAKKIQRSDASNNGNNGYNGNGGTHTPAPAADPWATAPAATAPAAPAYEEPPF